MERNGFVFYRSFWDSVESMRNDPDFEISDSELLKVLEATIKYGLDGEEVPLKGIAKAMFILIKPQLDANNARYENGKKGGRPKKTKGLENGKPMVLENETNGYENNSLGLGNPKPKEKDKDKDKDKEKEKDKDKLQECGCCLSSKLSTTEWDLILNNYEDAIGLIDLADDMAQGKEIKNPYRYIVGIASNRNWERKTS